MSLVHDLRDYFWGSGPWKIDDNFPILIAKDVINKLYFTSMVQDIATILYILNKTQ